MLQVRIPFVEGRIEMLFFANLTRFFDVEAGPTGPATFKLLFLPESLMENQDLQKTHYPPCVDRHKP